MDLDFHANYDYNTQYMKEFRISMTQLRLEELFSLDGTTPTVEENLYTIVGYELTLDRNSAPYIWSYHVPVSIMIILGSVSFWIPPETVPGRIALLVTLTLTLISVFNASLVSYDFYL